MKLVLSMKIIMSALLMGFLFSTLAFAQNRMSRNMPSPNNNQGNGYNYSHRKYSGQASTGGGQKQDYTPGYDKAYKQKYNQMGIPNMPSSSPYNNLQLYQYRNLYDYLPR
jgi:hypothetical protein